MTFSYDPPDRTLAEILHDALDADEHASGGDPTGEAARLLHEKLILHGQRHTLDTEAGLSGEHDNVVLRIPAGAALWLAGLLDEAFKPPTT